MGRKLWLLGLLLGELAGQTSAPCCWCGGEYFFNGLRDIIFKKKNIIVF